MQGYEERSQTREQLALFKQIAQPAFQPAQKLTVRFVKYFSVRSQLAVLVLSASLRSLAHQECGNDNCARCSVGSITG